MRVCIVLHTDLFEPWPVHRAQREFHVLKELGRGVGVVSGIKDESSPLPIHEVREGVRIRRVKFRPPSGPLARALGYRRISRMFAREIEATRPDAILCHALELLWSPARADRTRPLPVPGRIATPTYLGHVAVLDIGLALFYPTSANQRVVVPLKLFDYMGLGIPVIVSDFESMRRIVDQSGFGVTADPKDKGSIARAVRSLVDEPKRRGAMSAAALRSFETTYAWERQKE